MAGVEDGQPLIFFRAVGKEEIHVVGHWMRGKYLRSAVALCGATFLNVQKIGKSATCPACKQALLELKYGNQDD